ncbi:outer membrane protein, multidrug efflux system [Andreprevotia lacus DSM 23236]|uniref:Outer membrane protein, multidrug efflux system n=1 Tax=Andreprevotia lacus DSM 23236 TaxID=1121001 RepID=A0A1W1XJ53_9NEIS|nr:efflux transporter outer membrane subunit [Andreprevotia lacus]SMC23804.1 outer membrane protein, multidrug efflux system [Andreprevotia lacus DSM 23236]
MRNVLTLLPLAALISACSLAPTYERPALPVPVAAGNATAAQDVSLPQWQSYFADPVLRSLIEAALDNNRDLRVATARIQEARALYGVTNADRLPTLNATAAESANRVPAKVAGAPDDVVSRTYSANVGITAYELDFWGRVANLSESAKASYLGTVEAQRSARISLITAVANAYWSARSLNERADYAGKTAGAYRDSLKVVKRQYEVGTTSKLDALQAEAAVDSALAEQVSLQRQARNAVNALQLLVGQPVALPAPSAALVDTLAASKVPAGISSSTLLLRPDVRQAEFALKSANANIGAARAAFFPSITLTASTGVASNELGTLFSSGSGAWSFLPQIKLPLFDWGRNKASLDVAEARKVIAVAQYEKTVQTAFSEVANALSDQQGLEDYLVAQRRVVARQSDRLKIAMARYQAGVESYLQVLDAQRSLFAAQQSLIEASRARLAVTADVFKALGGDEQKASDAS